MTVTIERGVKLICVIAEAGVGKIQGSRMGSVTFFTDTQKNGENQQEEVAFFH